MLSELSLVVAMIFGGVLHTFDNSIFTNNDTEGQVKGVYTVSESGSIWENFLLMIKTPVITSSSTLEIDASSYLVYDEDSSKNLLRSNSKDRLPIASLSKIMTAYLVLENNELDETVTISENAYNTFGSKRGLVVGEKIKLVDLLRLMLIDSNNVAAVALAEHTSGDVQSFVNLMNKKAMDLELENTRFINPTGLDEEKGYNFSTTEDLVSLVEYIERNSLIWDFTTIKNDVIYSLDKKQVHSVKNTNILLGDVDNVLGGKTGYTSEAGECLFLMVENPKGGRIMAVVLGSEDRFSDVKKMIDWTLEVYKW